MYRIRLNFQDVGELQLNHCSADHIPSLKIAQHLQKLDLNGASNFPDCKQPLQMALSSLPRLTVLYLRQVLWSDVKTEGMHGLIRFFHLNLIHSCKIYKMDSAWESYKNYILSITCRFFILKRVKLDKNWTWHFLNESKKFLKDGHFYELCRKIIYPDNISSNSLGERGTGRNS